jgi:hypothetical protein
VGNSEKQKEVDVLNTACAEKEFYAEDRFFRTKVVSVDKRMRMNRIKNLRTQARSGDRSHAPEQRRA